MNRQEWNRIAELASKSEAFKNYIMHLDIDNCPLRTIRALIATAKDILAAQDQLQSNLYEIIGSGNLSSKGIDAMFNMIKKISESRPYIRSLADFEIPDTNPEVQNITAFE